MFEKEAEEYTVENVCGTCYFEKPYCEKPVFIKRCKEFEVCESVKQKGCKGCNVWNYLYDIKALQKWCKEHNEDFMQFTMKMHKMLKESE